MSSIIVEGKKIRGNMFYPYEAEVELTDRAILGLSFSGSEAYDLRGFEAGIKYRALAIFKHVYEDRSSVVCLVLHGPHGLTYKNLESFKEAEAQ